MRVGRLALKVYAYSVVTGLATIAIFVASFHFMMVADHGEPSRKGPFSAPHVTVYDVDGKLIGSTVTPPAPMISELQLRRLDQLGELELERGVVVRPVRDNGHLVGIAIASFRPPSPPEGLAPLAVPLSVLALLFLAATTIAAGHVVRPLQQLAISAKRFGRGDLSVRSGLSRKDELGDLGRAFDDMAERVTMLMAAQQELLVNVSHELLTPLSRIRVAVDLISDGEAAQAREMVGEITHDLLELERLLDDVMTVARLDLSRLHEGARLVPLKLASTSASDLVEQAVSRFRAQHPTHQVSVEMAGELPVFSADVVLLRRVLENLLDNARKYSDNGTAIHVRATLDRDRVSITVADSGIGVDAVDLENVFTPFFRTDKSRSRSTGGVGLGLALAKRVVEAHGGSIEIMSQSGEGTTVKLSLPIAPMFVRNIPT